MLIANAAARRRWSSGARPERGSYRSIFSCESKSEGDRRRLVTYGAFLAAASGNGECLFDTRSACPPAPKGGRGERAPTSLSMKGRGAESYFPSRSLLFPPSPRLCRVGNMHIRFTCNPFHVGCARVRVPRLEDGAQKCIWVNIDYGRWTSRPEK